MTSPAVKKILDALRANHDEAVRLRLELEKQLTAGAPDAGECPTHCSKLDIRRSLMGELHRLSWAFDWYSSPQGHRFWDAQIEAGSLTPEGRAILEKWLAE